MKKKHPSRSVQNTQPQEQLICKLSAEGDNAQYQLYFDFDTESNAPWRLCYEEGPGASEDINIDIDIDQVPKLREILDKIENPEAQQEARDKVQNGHATSVLDAGRRVTAEAVNNISDENKQQIAACLEAYHNSPAACVRYLNKFLNTTNINDINSSNELEKWKPSDKVDEQRCIKVCRFLSLVSRGVGISSRKRLVNHCWEQFFQPMLPAERMKQVGVCVNLLKQLNDPEACLEHTKKYISSIVAYRNEGSASDESRNGDNDILNEESAQRALRKLNLDKVQTILPLLSVFGSSDFNHSSSVAELIANTIDWCRLEVHIPLPTGDQASEASYINVLCNYIVARLDHERLDPNPLISVCAYLECVQTEWLKSEELLRTAWAECLLALIADTSTLENFAAEKALPTEDDEDQEEDKSHHSTKEHDEDEDEEWVDVKAEDAPQPSPGRNAAEVLHDKLASGGGIQQGAWQESLARVWKAYSQKKLFWKRDDTQSSRSTQTGSFPCYVDIFSEANKGSYPRYSIQKIDEQSDSKSSHSFAVWYEEQAGQEAKEIPVGGDDQMRILGLTEILDEESVTLLFGQAVKTTGSNGLESGKIRRIEQQVTHCITKYHVCRCLAYQVTQNLPRGNDRDRQEIADWFKTIQKTAIVDLSEKLLDPVRYCAWLDKSSYWLFIDYFMQLFLAEEQSAESLASQSQAFGRLLSLVDDQNQREPYASDYMQRWDSAVQSSSCEAPFSQLKEAISSQQYILLLSEYVLLRLMAVVGLKPEDDDYREIRLYLRCIQREYKQLESIAAATSQSLSKSRGAQAVAAKKAWEEQLGKLAACLASDESKGDVPFLKKEEAAVDYSSSTSALAQMSVATTHASNSPGLRSKEHGTVKRVDALREYLCQDVKLTSACTDVSGKATLSSFFMGAAQKEKSAQKVWGTSCDRVAADFIKEWNEARTSDDPSQAAVPQSCNLALK